MNNCKIALFGVCLFFGVQCGYADGIDCMYSKCEDNSIITPILDVRPIKGKNLIWCASFIALWKTLQEISTEEIKITGCDSITTILNKSIDCRSNLPDNSCKILVVKDMDTLYLQSDSSVTKKSEFKNGGNNLFAYCAFKNELQFKYPYKVSKHLSFKNEDGSQERIRYYGVRDKDVRRCIALRKQVKILYAKGGYMADDGIRYKEFAAELNGNDTENQIVLASLDIGNLTLMQIFEKIQKNISSARETGMSSYGIADIDVFLFPKVEVNLMQKLNCFNGKEIQNGAFKGCIIEAEQSVSFSLDNRGVRIKSEASMKTVSIRNNFRYENPFFLYVKKRDSSLPYFVMWVANLKKDL